MKERREYAGENQNIRYLCDVSVVSTKTKSESKS